MPLSVILHHSRLTHLCRMHFPILINWTSLFPILGLLGGIFHFYSSFKRSFCKQTVENLIRRRVLRRLIWFCTVCRCPIKRTLDLYGLIRVTQIELRCKYIIRLRVSNLNFISLQLLGPRYKNFISNLLAKETLRQYSVTMPSMVRYLSIYYLLHTQSYL